MEQLLISFINKQSANKHPVVHGYAGKFDYAVQ